MAFASSLASSENAAPSDAPSDVCSDCCIPSVLFDSLLPFRAPCGTRDAVTREAGDDSSANPHKNAESEQLCVGNSDSPAWRPCSDTDRGTDLEVG